MKKFLFSLIAIAVMAFGFVACGNNDGGNKGGDAKAGIVGNWYYSDDIFYTFNEDGTGSYTVNGNVFNTFTYTEKPDEGQLILNNEGTTQPTTFNYKLEGKKLTILAGLDNWGSDTEYTKK